MKIAQRPLSDEAIIESAREIRSAWSAEECRRRRQLAQGRQQRLLALLYTSELESQDARDDDPHLICRMPIGL